MSTRLKRLKRELIEESNKRILGESDFSWVTDWIEDSTDTRYVHVFSVVNGEIDGEHILVDRFDYGETELRQMSMLKLRALFKGGKLYSSPTNEPTDRIDMENARAI